MNDADVKAMLSPFAVSFYDHIDHPKEKDLGPKFDPKTVPIVRGKELIAAMLENVEEAKWCRDQVRQRWERAERAGVFDMESLKASSEDAQADWIAVLNILQGDKDRCVSEITHWRKYAQTAIDGQFSTLKDDHSGSEIVRELAGSKSLPTTAEAEAEANQARRKIAADLERWQASNPEPDRRLPPEKDDEPASEAVPF